TLFWASRTGRTALDKSAHRKAGGLRLPQITATIGLPSFNPQIHDADLRRFQTRAVRLVWSVPRHRRRDAGVRRRVRSAADASRRGSRRPFDAQGAVGLGLASLLDHDA